MGEKALKVANLYFVLEVRFREGFYTQRRKCKATMGSLSHTLIGINLWKTKYDLKNQ